MSEYSIALNGGCVHFRPVLKFITWTSRDLGSAGRTDSLNIVPPHVGIEVATLIWFYKDTFSLSEISILFNVFLWKYSQGNGHMYCKNGCNMCSYKQNVWKYKLGKKNIYKNRFVCILLRCTLVWSCYKMLWRDNHTIFEVMITHLHTHTHCWLFQIARSLGLDPVDYTVVPVAKLDEYMNSVRTVHLFF